MHDHEVGERFVRALAAKDREGVLATLSPDVDFRGLTPGKFWEASTAQAAVDEVFFGPWFESTDIIKNLLSAETHTVGDRNRIEYQMEMADGTGEHPGAFVVEQQAYYGVQDGKISWLRIMCSGWLPLS